MTIPQLNRVAQGPDTQPPECDRIQQGTGSDRGQKRIERRLEHVGGLAAGEIFHRFACRAPRHDQEQDRAHAMHQRVQPAQARPVEQGTDEIDCNVAAGEAAPGQPAVHDEHHSQLYQLVGTRQRRVEHVAQHDIEDRDEHHRQNHDAAGLGDTA